MIALDSHQYPWLIKPSLLKISIDSAERKPKIFETMYQDLIRVFKHSVIYGIGNIISKIGAFILIPVYTRYLAPAEYGKLELFYVTSSILSVFLGVGIAHATLRFFFEYESDRDRRSVIGSALVSSGVIGILFLLILFPLSEAFSVHLLKTPDHAFLFKLVFMMLWLNVSMEISQAFIRAKEMSVFYVIVSAIQLLVRLALNLHFLIALGMGIKGILLGDLLSTFLAWFILTSVTARYSKLSFEASKLREMFFYSYPIVVGSLGALILGNADRYFLNLYSGLSAVGLYALGGRFSMVLNALYSDPFRQSYGPYRFSIMKREDAKIIYAKVLTYFLYGAVFIGLFVSATSRELIQIVATRPFLDAHKVVPIILIGSVVGQCYYILQIGIYLQKRTGAVSWILPSVAVLNILFNLILIPTLGLYGAGVAALLSSLGLCAVTLVISQKLYPIPYEWGRIVQLFSVAFGLFLLTLTIRIDHVFLSLGVKMMLLLAYPVILYFIGFYREEELQQMYRGYAKLRVMISGSPESTQA